MSQTCDNCGTVVYRRKMMMEPPNKGKFFGVDCGCIAKDYIPRQCSNPFDIEFQHVNDEFGNRLRVHNIRELSAAEKRLGFTSVVLNSDAQNFDDPPQQRKMDMASVHRWRYSNESRFRESHGR